jgi:predicted transcriptional regulator
VTYDLILDHTASRRGFNMALVTITKASHLAGLTRQSIYRHIKQGKVSAITQNDGTKKIDTSELLRVYGEIKDFNDDNVTIAAGNKVSKAVNVELLEYKIEVLEKQLKESEVRNDNSLEQNKSLTDIIKSQSLTLEHAKRPGIIERLFNKKG